MADELEKLRQQLELERGLREAADAENERLQAQVEAYAEDMAALFQEQHGRGRDGLAAEAATLRAQLADESAQREVVARLHKRSVERTRELSEQLVTAGEDVSKAFREGKRVAASGGGPWWRRPAGFIPIATTVAGLMVGAGGYAAIAPTPTPAVAGLSADGPAYGPPIPPELGGSGIMVASGGRLQPLGPGMAGSTDPAAIAATAAAAAFAPPNSSILSTPAASVIAASGTSAASASGTPLVASALATTPTPMGTADAVATTVAAAASAAGSSPAATGVTTGANLGPTVTAFAATGTALAGVATSAAATAAAGRIAVTPLPTATPTAEVIDLSASEPTKRCRFELLIPPLPTGQGYAIHFQQRNPADVVVLWSDQAGQVGLEQIAANGSTSPLAGATAAAGGRGVFARQAPPGAYRATLVKSDLADESRVALFYDTSSGCFPEPKGQPADDVTLLVGTEPAATSTPPAGPPSPTPLPASPTPPPAAPASTSTPAPAALAPAATPTPVATPTSAPRSPTAVPPTPTPVTPYVYCRPYLRGPSKLFQLEPQVYTDAPRTVLGTWPLRATLTGPGVNQTETFTASPGGEPRVFQLGGFGTYRLRTEAEGADLDPDCSWEFDHNVYS